MPLTPGFKEFLEDLFLSFGPVSIRNMFSGAGVYAEGVMFAILVNDTLYLKADAVSARLRGRGESALRLPPQGPGADRHVLLGGARSPARRP
jgi:TfoX/Sxy family transcriptional regulator of competence genes